MWIRHWHLLILSESLYMTYVFPTFNNSSWILYSINSLSGYLAEATGNPSYTNAALLSANWIKNVNLNSNDIVLDTVSGADCSRSPSNWLFTYNSGKYVEGLSVLANITNDSSWTQLQVEIFLVEDMFYWYGNQRIAWHLLLQIRQSRQLGRAVMALSPKVQVRRATMMLLGSKVCDWQLRIYRVWYRHPSSHLYTWSVWSVREKWGLSRFRYFDS